MTMHRSVGGLAAFVVAALAASPGLGVAQTQVPAREGNIWGGLNHEPTPSQVLPQEEAAGVGQRPAQQKKQNDDVETLFRSLMRAEGQPAK